MESIVISPGQQAWLIGLLALWFGLLCGGFVLGKPDSQGNRCMPLATRIGSSAVLVISGWSWFCIAEGTDVKAYAGFVATGMSFGFFGDLVLARVIPVARRVAVGMALFGLGHIAYILAFASFGSNYPMQDPRLHIGVWVGWMTVGAMGWWLAVCRGSQPTGLSWAALVYSLLLTGTAALATTLALKDANFIPTAVGAGLFVVSDTILAAVLFNRLHSPLIHDAVWLTYGPAQMLIVYSVCAALRTVS
jgi:hypothetical protein